MSRIYKSVEATQWVRVACSGSDDDGPINVSELPVSFAFLSPGVTPVEAAWTEGEWGTETTARIKIGPDGLFDLPASDYVVWVQIVTTDETVQLPAGFLTVGEGVS